MTKQELIDKVWESDVADNVWEPPEQCTGVEEPFEIREVGNGD